MDAATLSGLLAPLFADLGSDTPWLRFLAELGRVLPCGHPTIVARSPHRHDRGLLVSSEPDLGGANPYREGLFDQTPFRDLAPGEVATLRTMLSGAELERLPYYRTFLAPAGVSDLIAVDLVDRRSGLTLRLRGSRGMGAPPFAAAEVVLLRQLLPHLQAALELHGVLTGQRSLLALYERSAERLGIGMALLAETRRVVFVNAMLRSMQREGCPLRVRGDTLTCRHAEDERRLRAVFDRMLAPGDQPPAGVHLLFDEAEGGAWSVLAEPFPDRVAADPRARPAIMLLVRAPGHFRAPSAAQLARQLPLTPAEIALAMQLTAGRTIEEAAAALGVSRNTVRNQLATIFAKLGVKRQAELVRLILEIGVNLWPDPIDPTAAG